MMTWKTHCQGGWWYIEIDGFQYGPFLTRDAALAELRYRV